MATAEMMVLFAPIWASLGVPGALVRENAKSIEGATTVASAAGAVSAVEAASKAGVVGAAGAAGRAGVVGAAGAAGRAGVVGGSGVVREVSASVPSAPIGMKVDRVVVYVDRAEVSRKESVPCVNDRAELAFPLLPPSLDLRTLRAQGVGKATAIGLTSAVVPVEADRDVRRAEVEKRLRAVEARIRELWDTVQGERERAKSGSEFAAYFAAVLREELRGPRPNPEAWRKVLTAIESDELRARRGEVNAQAMLRPLAEEADRLSSRLSAFDATIPRAARLARVGVECGGASRAEVVLSYVVPGATWHPEYDLRFFPAKNEKVGPGTVEMTVGAVVQQSTGEDWEGAEIVLSTAKPRLGAEAPELAPLVVDGQPAAKGQVLVQATEDRRSLRAGADPASGALASAVLEDGGKSFALTLPHRVSLFSDGRPYWMPVDEVKGRGESILTTIPKLSPYVYQAVRTTNPAPYPLLAGRAHIHRGASYVGDVALAHVAPGEPMEVSLGLDEEVAVERIDVKVVDRQPGVFGNKLRMERELSIKVSNRARRTERIEVQEQLPVSKDERIEVELDTKKTSAGGNLDRERGILTWMVEVPKGGSKRLDFAYRILLPKDWKME